MIYLIGWCLCRWIAQAFFGLRIDGVEHVPETGPVILAPNHVSYLDPMLVGASIRRRAHFMAKKELFKNRLAAWILRSVQAYPVTRERLDPSTLKHALSLLKGGELLLIFPEGTRGDGRRLGPAKPGLAAIAARSGASVVPVFHWGTERALPRKSRWIRRVPLRVRFGPPLRFVGNGETGRQALEVFGQQVMDAISALRPAEPPWVSDPQ